LLSLLLPLAHQLQLHAWPPAALLLVVQLCNAAAFSPSPAWLSSWSAAVKQQLPRLSSDSACRLFVEVLQLKQHLQQHLAQGLLDDLFVAVLRDLEGCGSSSIAAALAAVAAAELAGGSSSDGEAFDAGSSSRGTAGSSITSSSNGRPSSSDTNSSSSSSSSTGQHLDALHGDGSTIGGLESAAAAAAVEEDMLPGFDNAAAQAAAQGQPKAARAPEPSGASHTAAGAEALATEQAATLSGDTGGASLPAAPPAADAAESSNIVNSSAESSSSSLLEAWRHPAIGRSWQQQQQQQHYRQVQKQLHLARQQQQQQQQQQSRDPSWRPGTTSTVNVTAAAWISGYDPGSGGSGSSSGTAALLDDSQLYPLVVHSWVVELGQQQRLQQLQPVQLAAVAAAVVALQVKVPPGWMDRSVMTC